jgi:hypothetical protein
MSKKTGYVVEFTTDEGVLQKGYVYHVEQSSALAEANKFLVHFINNDLKTPVLNHINKPTIKMVDKVKCKTIGYLN